MRKLRISPALAISALAVLALPRCGKGPESDQWIPVSGLIEAVQTDVRAQVQGEIGKILVQEGQPVDKGDLLCTHRRRTAPHPARPGQGRTGRGPLQARAGPDRDARRKSSPWPRTRSRPRPNSSRSRPRTRSAWPGSWPRGPSPKARRKRPTWPSRPPRNSTEAPEGELRHGRPRPGKRGDRHGPGRDPRPGGPGAADPPRALRDTEVRVAVDRLIIEVKPGGARASWHCPAPCSSASSTSPQPTSRPTSPNASWDGCSWAGASASSATPCRARSSRAKSISSPRKPSSPPRTSRRKEERLKLVYMVKSYLDNPAGELKPGMPVDVTIILAPVGR